MASTAEPASVLPFLAYTALQAVQTVKVTSMPRPAKRKRKRRPSLSTVKAKQRETRKAQMVRPPFIRAWFVELGSISWD